MYKTVKNVKTFNRNNLSTNAQIDLLFGGVDLTNIHMMAPAYMQERLVRTTTFETTEVPGVEQPRLQFSLACLHGICNDTLKLIPIPEQAYHSFKIPKKTKGFRNIDAPNPELKDRQKLIANYIVKDLEVLAHDSAWAYTSGRDVVGAMKEHINNKSRWFLKIDLKNFFGSCTPEFIAKQLKNIYPFGLYADYDLMIDALTVVACKDGGLPQGTPLSPIITNLCMVEYDYKMNKLIYELTKKDKLLKQKYIYTRYADDIIISAQNKFDYQVLVKAIKKLFKDTPLVINEEKTRFGSNAGRNWNLGVMCNKDNKMTIGYKKKKELKNTIYHYLTDDSIWDLESLRWLLGQLSWLRNVEFEYFQGVVDYYYKKTHINVWTKLIHDIKSYNN